MCCHPYIKQIDGVYTPLPCGKCIECYKATQFDWRFRIEQELKNWRFCWYVTLTYNDESLPEIDYLGTRYSVVIKSEVQNFLKRLRQRIGYVPLKYYAVGEYGGKHNRAHYHLLLFTDAFVNRWSAYTNILQAWSPRGFVYVKLAKTQQFHYLTKYLNKLDKRNHFQLPFRLVSRYFGLSFLSADMVAHLSESLSRRVYNSGHLVRLPRYYVKKMDEIYNRHGLNWSQTCSLFSYYCKNNLSEYRGYIDYFCHNVDDIRDIFIQSELDNNYITKFLQPDVNLVFDWYLHQNKVTRDYLSECESALDKVVIKEQFDTNFAVGNARLLDYDKFNDF